MLIEISVLKNELTEERLFAFTECGESQRPFLVLTAGELLELQTSIKQVTESLAFQPGSNLQSDLNKRLLQLVQTGGKIAAIQECRAVLRCGLKEAKDYVENLMQQEGVI